MSKRGGAFAMLFEKKSKRRFFFPLYETFNCQSWGSGNVENFIDEIHENDNIRLTDNWFKKGGTKDNLSLEGKSARKTYCL